MQLPLLHRIQATGLRALIVLVLDPAAAAAQDQILTVVPGRDTDARVLPGQVFTLPFQIISTTPDSLRLLSEIDLPAQWKAMGDTGAVTVAPGGTALWLVSLGVPNGATAGLYFIPLRLRREGTQQLVYEDTLRLEIAERARVQLRVLASPQYLITGDTASLRYMVENRGNARAEFRVEVLTGPDLRAERRDSLLVLEPGALAERTLLLRAASVDQSRTVRLRLLAVGGGQAQVRDSANMELVIVPKTELRRGMYHHVPARLRLISDGISAPAVGELSGTGQLFDGYGPDLSFDIRSSHGSHSLQYERDRYSLALSGEQYRVKLGDQVFEAGGLSGGAQLGFGAEATLERGPVSAGGYVSRDRYSTGAVATGSAFVSYRLGGVHELTSRLSALDTRNGAVGSVASLAYAGSPLAGNSLRVEYGVAPAGGELAQGYLVEARGQHRWMRYNFTRSSGDPQLPGALAGSTSTSGGLTLSPLSGLSFGAAGYTYRYQWMAGQYSSQSSGRSLQLFADFRGLAGMEYRRSDGTHGVDLDATTQGTEALRLRGGLRLQPLMVNGAYELGHQTQHSTGAKAPYAEITAMPTLSLGTISLSGTARYMQPRGEVEVAGAGWSLSGSLIGRLPTGTDVFLTVNDFAPLVEGLDRARQLEFRWDQELPRKHLLTARVQHFSSGSYMGQPTRVSLEYSIPLKIPTGKTHSPSRVVGRVIDEAGAGLGGVVVRLQDQMMVTDPTGYVVFSNVQQGTHVLDASSLRDPGRIALGDPAVTVGTRPARNPFEIRMVAGARLRGTIRFLARTSSYSVHSAAPEDGVSLENIVVRLESATETLYLVTDPRGNFDAGRIRSGRWTVTCTGESLPAGYELEQSRVELVVEPGEERSVELLVRPRRRDIRMIASGEVLVMKRPGQEQQPRVVAALPVEGTIPILDDRGVAVKPADLPSTTPSMATAPSVFAASSTEPQPWWPVTVVVTTLVGDRVVFATLPLPGYLGGPGTVTSGVAAAAPGDADTRRPLQASPVGGDPGRSGPAEPRQEPENDPERLPREARLPWQPHNRGEGDPGNPPRNPEKPRDSPPREDDET